MGLNESHISLTFQWYMTFTPPHKQIFIEILIFTDFFLSVWINTVGTCTNKALKNSTEGGSTVFVYWSDNVKIEILDGILAKLHCNTS